MKPSFPEIFKAVDKTKNRQDKIDMLRSRDSTSLRQLLWLAFDPTVQWHVPEGEPPYKKEKDIPAGMAPSNLYIETKRLYIWVESNKTPRNLNQIRREHLFIQFLEGIHWTEADLIINIKDKKFTEVYETIDYDLVNEAFPGLLSPLPEPVKKPRRKAAAKKVKEVAKNLPLE